MPLLELKIHGIEPSQSIITLSKCKFYFKIFIGPYDNNLNILEGIIFLNSNSYQILAPFKANNGVLGTQHFRVEQLLNLQSCLRLELIINSKNQLRETNDILVLNQRKQNPKASIRKTNTFFQEICPKICQQNSKLIHPSHQAGNSLNRSHSCLL